ncbi:MAG: hypothetical protein AB7P04_02875 [Bacteriovoracia bacterium]
MLDNLKTKLEESLRQARDWLNDQVWFQELKAKWEEFDPQSQLYIKYATAGIGAFMLVIFVLSTMARVGGVRRDYEEKSDLLTYIRNSQLEMKVFKKSGMDQASELDALDPSRLNEFFKQKATLAEMPDTAVEVSMAKVGNSTETVKESLFDLTIKHVSIKKLARYALELERATIKVRNMSIDTVGADGYLDAKMSVSAFKLAKTEEK